jgi:hypothetical protein
MGAGRSLFHKPLVPAIFAYPFVGALLKIRADWFPLAALLALSLAGWFLWRRVGASQIYTDVGTLIGIGAVALLFGSELSYPLWQYHSPLQRLQFPDRFNTILLAAALLALALANLQAWRKERRPGVRYLLSAALSYRWCSASF